MPVTIARARSTAQERIAVRPSVFVSALDRNERGAVSADRVFRRGASARVCRSGNNRSDRIVAVVLRLTICPSAGLAEASFRAAIEHDPSQPLAFYYLGVILHERPAPDLVQAEELYRRSWALDPTNTVVAYTIARLHHAAHDKPRVAERWYRDALALDPTFSLAHYRSSRLAQLSCGRDSFFGREERLGTTRVRHHIMPFCHETHTHIYFTRVEIYRYICNIYIWNDEEKIAN